MRIRLDFLKALAEQGYSCSLEGFDLHIKKMGRVLLSLETGRTNSDSILIEAQDAGSWLIRSR